VTDIIPNIAPPPELLDALQSARRPLLIAHISPDGDAIGSLTDMGYLLYRMGKDPILACQDKAPNSFNFLPFYDRITQNVEDANADLVIALDSSDPTRMGTIYDSNQFADLPLLVIDHHITNTQYGDINLIDPSMPSASSVVLQMLREK